MFRAFLTISAVTFAVWTDVFAEAETEPTSFASADWQFQKTTKDSLLRSHPLEVGILNHRSEMPPFLTTPVVVIEKNGISLRSPSARLAIMEQEIGKFVKLLKLEKPTFKSLKILDSVPTLELAFGGSKKAPRWLHATVRGDQIYILSTESREKNPSESVRTLFYQMARQFTLPEG